MSSGEAVLAEVDGRVGRITLNRPEAKNAITVELSHGLAAAVRELEPEVDVLVIRGAGGTFCAGGDVPQLEALRAKGRDDLATMFHAFRDARAAIAQAEVPVVAVVEGHAVAGGFELLQSCDIVLAAESAVFSDIHARFGQIPGGGGTQLLPRLVGLGRASGLVLTGDQLTARQAQEWGLVYTVAPDASLEAELDSLISRLTRGSRAARTQSKRLMRAGLEMPLDEGLDLEAEAVIDHILGDAGQAATDAFAHRKDGS
ncbi:MAG TPA: enoyl-CoA hydratase-related protein [Sporichthya sp.]|nr:enoyl-CoA hydratase-related protein [Sporichthya sp.]